jgi:ATP-binding cassette, subfamily C (CFTR/MRP), member 1
MWWFESQPIGRIMNRFSKDMEAIDQRLMPQLFQLVAGIGSLISTIVILGYSTPIILGKFEHDRRFLEPRSRVGQHSSFP